MSSVCLYKLLTVEDRLFASQRVRIYAVGVVIVLSIILFRVIGSWFWFGNLDRNIPGIDFCWIWFSGKFVGGGNALNIYNRALYEAAYNNYFRSNECHLLLEQYVYPPTFLFLTYPLGIMPYPIAFGVWVGTTLLLYLSAIYLILPGWPAMVLALTPFAAFFNILIGHNGFLTAGLVGLALRFIERRPSLGGILLGLLTYKPHFGVMFPAALLATRNWRALVSAATIGLAFAAAAAIVFGQATWPAFFASLFDRSAGLSPNPGVALLLDSAYGLLHWAGVGVRVAAVGQLAVTVGLALVVGAVWAKPVRYPLKAATLSIASVLAAPYVLPYDLSILSIAAAFLVRDGLSHGFLAGERSSILLGLVVLYFPLAPVGAIVGAILLLAVLRRIALTADLAVAAADAVSAPTTVRGE